jgi:hypothetical protein
MDGVDDVDEVDKRGTRVKIRSSVVGLKQSQSLVLWYANR